MEYHSQGGMSSSRRCRRTARWAGGRRIVSRRMNPITLCAWRTQLMVTAEENWKRTLTPAQLADLARSFESFDEHANRVIEAHRRPRSPRHGYTLGQLKPRPPPHRHLRQPMCARPGRSQRPSVEQMHASLLRRPQTTTHLGVVGEPIPYEPEYVGGAHSATTTLDNKCVPSASSSSVSEPVSVEVAKRAPSTTVKARGAAVRKTATTEPVSVEVATSVPSTLVSASVGAGRQDALPDLVVAAPVKQRGTTVHHAFSKRSPDVELATRHPPTVVRKNVTVVRKASPTRHEQIRQMLRSRNSFIPAVSKPGVDAGWGCLFRVIQSALSWNELPVPSLDMQLSMADHKPSDLTQQSVCGEVDIAPGDVLCIRSAAYFVVALSAGEVLVADPHRALGQVYQPMVVPKCLTSVIKLRLNAPKLPASQRQPTPKVESVQVKQICPKVELPVESVQVNLPCLEVKVPVKSVQVKLPRPEVEVQVESVQVMHPRPDATVTPPRQLVSQYTQTDPPEFVVAGPDRKEIPRGLFAHMSANKWRRSRASQSVTLPSVPEHKVLPLETCAQVPSQCSGGAAGQTPKRVKSMVTAPNSDKSMVTAPRGKSMVTAPNRDKSMVTAPHSDKKTSQNVNALPLRVTGNNQKKAKRVTECEGVRKDLG
eukprot:5452874-Amphidinium_carterae.1